MFKKIKTICIGSLLSFVFASTALAQDFGLKETASRGGYSSSQSDVFQIANTVITVILSVLGIIFLGIMIYAGLRWMTARGNEELVSKAKKALTAGIIGMIVTALTYGIASFVLNRLVG